METARNAPRGIPSSDGSILDSGRDRLADGLERIGERLEDRAQSYDEEPGLKGAVGQAAHRTGDLFERGAAYVRTHEVTNMREDLRGQIARHPLLSVGMAVGTGYMIGRLFAGRDDEPPGMVGSFMRPFGRALVGGAGAILAAHLTSRMSDAAERTISEV